MLSPVILLLALAAEKPVPEAVTLKKSCDAKVAADCYKLAGFHKRGEGGAARDLEKSADFLKKIGLSNDGSARAGTTFVNRTMPAGTKVTFFSADTATIEVWCNGLFGLAGEDSTNPVTSTWFTVTMKLNWSGGDWKVLESSQKSGPTPVTAGFPVYRAEPVIEPVMPATRPVSPATGAPVDPAVDEPGRPAAERAEHAARAASSEATSARDEARNAAADAPGAPRPPFHG